MHNSTKFYLNMIIISEVIYCSMYKNVILKKITYKYIFSIFLLHEPKIRYFNCASMRKFGLFETSK